MNRVQGDPDRFWVYEVYDDQAAFTAHRDSEVMAAAGPVFGELIADSEFVLGETVSAKGLPG